MPLLVIVGPTACGKSGVAMSLARELRAEIVSADSMQVYRGMDVGTAKPSRQDLQEVTHHLVDIISPEVDFDVAQYQELARNAIADIHARDRLPILVGGTGLYIRAVIDGLSLAPADESGLIRTRLEEIGEREGEAGLRRLLSTVDPVAESAILPGNLRRLVRALEVHELTGKPFSSYHSAVVGAATSGTIEGAGYAVEMIGLERERPQLYARIEERVEEMFSSGILAEAEVIRSALGRSDRAHRADHIDHVELSDPSRRAAGTASHAIGYREGLAHLNGDITLFEAIQATKTATRRYAKRQLTWFRRDERVHWVDVSGSDGEDAADAVRRHLSSCRIWGRVSRFSTERRNEALEGPGTG